MATTVFLGIETDANHADPDSVIITPHANTHGIIERAGWISEPKGPGLDSIAMFHRFGLQDTDPTYPRGCGIPAGATIDDAVFSVVARETDATNYLVRFATLPYDGKWDRIDNTPGWTEVGTTINSGGYKVRNRIQSTAFADLVTNQTVGSLELPFTGIGDQGANNAQFSHAMSGVFTPTSTANLGQITLKLRRNIVGDSPNMVVTIYAKDGSSDFPTGSALAISDTVPYNNLATAVGGFDKVFAFSGGDQISLTSGTDYVWTIGTEAGDGGLTNLFASYFVQGQAIETVGRELGIKSNQTGFTVGNYVSQIELPHIWNGDNTTRLAPVAKTLSIASPSFVNTVRANFPDFTALIQDWVDDPSYDPAKPIGMELFAWQNDVNWDKLYEHAIGALSGPALTVNWTPTTVFFTAAPTALATFPTAALTHLPETVLRRVTGLLLKTPAPNLFSVLGGGHIATALQRLFTVGDAQLQTFDDGQTHLSVRGTLSGMADITAVPEPFNIRKNDRLPAFQVDVFDSDENPVDVSGGTVVFTMVARDGTLKVDRATAAAVVGVDGSTVSRLSYTWGATDTDTSGRYRAEFEVTVGGLKRTFPASQDQRLEVIVNDDLDAN